MRRPNQPSRFAAAMLLPLLVVVSLQAQDSEPAAVKEREPGMEPIQSGLTEETEVRRLFIDVEAIDENGDPMPDLTREDFKIRLNHFPRTIETLDNLCPCVGDMPSMPSSAIDEEDPEFIRLAQSRTRFVLYFEISQLARSGRRLAAEHARKWVNEVVQPADEVMIMAYSTESGLIELSPFTSEPERLLEAIDEAETSPELEDRFPLELGKRLEQCRSGTLSCYNTGRQDYFQMRRSLWAMLGFLTRMNEIGGRKALLMFHQHMTMFPGRVHQGAYSEDVPDLIELTGEVGAAATASRTEVYPIAIGPTHGWAINLGANLADFSGGLHNGLGAGTTDVLSRAGRGCRCIYRIGLEPPSDKTRIYTVKVKAQGWVLPNRYRAHYLERKDRWARKAEAVLTNPLDAWDFELRVAILPEKLEAGRWRLKAQVALDLGQLEPSPIDGIYEWEVGALLTEVGSRNVKEMLAVTHMDAGQVQKLGPLVLHEREFEELDPAVYELRAYIHDRNGKTYAGARTKLELTDDKPGGITGPVALRRHASYWLARLPLRERHDEIERIPVVRHDASWMPEALIDAWGDDEIVFLSWACPGKKSKGSMALQRFVSNGSGEDLALDFEDVSTGVECVHVNDRVVMSERNRGRYEYRIESSPERFAGSAEFDLSD